MVLYLAELVTFLPSRGEEINRRHPLLRAQPCLSRKVVQVSDQTLSKVLGPGVFAVGVDLDDILGDVICGQVLHIRRIHLGHLARGCVTLRNLLAAVRCHDDYWRLNFDDRSDPILEYIIRV